MAAARLLFVVVIFAHLGESENLQSQHFCPYVLPYSFAAESHFGKATPVRALFLLAACCLLSAKEALPPRRCTI